MADAVAPKGRWSRRMNTILEADETVREMNGTITRLNRTLDDFDIVLSEFTVTLKSFEKSVGGFDRVVELHGRQSDARVDAIVARQSRSFPGLPFRLWCAPAVQPASERQVGRRGGVRGVRRTTRARGPL